MRNQVFKKLFSVLLALIMVAGLLPASVLAEGEGNADSTPAPTEAVQPTESAEPTAPTETETPEVTEVPEPTPENPAATVEPTQGEPTAEPTDEGIMPANVMPVQANLELQYRIVHLDCGRKYFSKDWIIALMYEAKAAGYNQVQLAFGNKGLRFLLDDMSVTVNGTKYDAKSAIQDGNKAYYNAGEKNELTEAEMDEIFTAAEKIGIEIVPLFNTPFHMEAVITAMGQLNIQDAYYGSNKACLNLSNNTATAFVKALMQKYIDYFKGKCKYFNFGADEYTGGWNSTFYNYANEIVSMISAAGMKARIFNDSFRSDSNNGYVNNAQVCYWSSNSGYASTATVYNYAKEIINTNQDFYYVVNKDTQQSTWSPDSYYAFSGSFDETTWVNYAKNFSNTTYKNFAGYNNGAESITPVGSMFCIWCDNPSHKDETQIAKEIRMILRVIGARMQNKNDYSASDVLLVEGGFKADGTINVPTNNKIVGNDNDTVRVTGPNLAALTAPEHTGEIAGIEAVEGRIMAYDVTPSTADNTYTGEAEVRIKIPAEWDSSKVNAFIVGNDSTVNDITGKTEDGWYVFTAPHFSVMGIYEKAATTEVGGTITIVEGKEEVLTVDGEVAKNKIGDPADTAVAIKTGVEYGTKPGEGTQFTLGNKITTGDGVISDGNGNYMVVSDTGSISNTTEIANATVFTVTSSSGYWTTTYTIQVKDKSQYLTINNNNKLAIQNSSSSWDYYDGYGFYQQKSWNNYYYLKFNNGWTASTGNGTSGYLYERKGNAILVDVTKVTIKGIAGGETTIEIDGKTYTIKVVDATLAEQKIDVELWITNGGVVPTGWDSNPPAGFVYQDCLTLNNWTGKAYITVNAGQYGFNSEGGVVLHEAILGNVLTGTTTYGNSNEGTKVCDVEYWKTAYHTKDNRQEITGWTNNSHLGIEFKYLRYWENSWAYSADRVNWVEISDISATDSTKNQISIFYREPTTITDEVSTKVVDWGPTTYGIYQSLLDFAVKYESLDVRVPDAFPVSKKTIGFTRCEDTGNTQYRGTDSNGDAYRIVYGIAGVETADYEVYMITATNYKDSHTSSDRLTYSSVPSSYTYSGDEVVVWAKETTDATNSGLTVSDNLKTAADTNGEPYLESVNIYEYQALLITYYLRAKGGLKVHYIARNNGSEDEFYSYKIAVEKNTTFGNIAQPGPTIEADTVTINGKKYDYIKNGEVKNIKGKYEYVTHVLTLIPEIKAQYRYTSFTCVEIKLSEDGKEAFLYYEFNNAKTYVVDFGIPLKIKLTDLNSELANATITSVKITGQTHGTAVYNESEMAIIYTLTKVLSERERLSVDVIGTKNGKTDNVTYNVTIIPATNVYYEDSFAKFYGSDGNEQTGFSKTNEVPDQKPGVWYIDGQEKTANQALEALGEKTNHNVYGYDPAYQDSTMFSMGSARKVTVDGSGYAQAKFTFKGTGFDVISLTDNNSGAITVEVLDSEGKTAYTTAGKKVFYLVNNYYGYTYNEGTNNWEANPTSDNAIYQVPVIKVRDLNYGEYTAVISVDYAQVFDKTGDSKYSFWLDAVRVYDPAGSDLDKDYVKDSEVKPIYVEVRKALIGQDGFTAVGSGLTNGAVFIDGKAEGATIDDYKNFGPNHEVYLAGNQAIAFRIVADREPATVQIGVKLANGSTGTLKISGASGSALKFAKYNGSNDEVAENESLTLNTATDMYYALEGITWTEKSGSQESNVIVLTNTGSDIVSITNVKCTYKSITENTTNTVTLAISYDDALMAVDAVNNAIIPVEPEPEPEPEPEKTFEPDRFEASWSRNVMQGRKATLTVKTSEDVEAITVDGQTIRSYRTRTERMGFGRRAKRITYREFTYSMVAQESADFSVTAINAEGTESEAITARLTVKTRPNSMRDMWDWFKGWF